MCSDGTAKPLYSCSRQLFHLSAQKSATHNKLVIWSLILEGPTHSFNIIPPRIFPSNFPNIFDMYVNCLIFPYWWQKLRVWKTGTIILIVQLWEDLMHHPFGKVIRKAVHSPQLRADAVWLDTQTLTVPQDNIALLKHTNQVTSDKLKIIWVK